MDPTQNNDSFGSLSSGGGGPVAGGVEPTAGASAAGAGDSPAPVTSGASVAADSNTPAPAPATGAPVVSAPAPGPVGGNTIFPGTVGVAGVSSESTGLGSAVGLGGASFSGTAGAGTATTNAFGQTGANTGQANAIFGQGDANAVIPSNTATGDVVIGGGAKEKPKKALVIGAIAAVVLIVVGLVVGTMLGRGGESGGGGSADITDRKTAFNSYANYVMFGENSSEDLTEDEITNYDIYFWNLRTDEDAILKYVVEANKKFGDLKTSYIQDDDLQTALSDMSEYFQVFPMALPLTIKELSDAYDNGGRSGAEELIEKRYSINEYSGDEEELSSAFLNYLDVASSLSMMQLDVIEKAKEGGCVIGDTLENSCYMMGEEEFQEAEGYSAELNDYMETMGQSAYFAIRNIFNDVYGYGDENEDEGIEEEEQLEDDSQNDEGGEE